MGWVDAGSEGYLSGGMPGVGDPGENTMAKTVTITLGAAAIYMMLVMGLMIWCRFRRARRKAMLLLQVTSEGDFNTSTNAFSWSSYLEENISCNIFRNNQSILSLERYNSS